MAQPEHRSTDEYVHSVGDVLEQSQGLLDALRTDIDLQRRFVNTQFQIQLAHGNKKGNHLKVRKTPGIGKSDKIGEVYHNQWIQPTGRIEVTYDSSGRETAPRSQNSGNREHFWLEIRHPSGQTGWISADYLDDDGMHQLQAYWEHLSYQRDQQEQQRQIEAQRKAEIRARRAENRKRENRRKRQEEMRNTVATENESSEHDTVDVVSEPETDPRREKPEISISIAEPDVTVVPDIVIDNTDEVPVPAPDSDEKEDPEVTVTIPEPVDDTPVIVSDPVVTVDPAPVVPSSPDLDDIPVTTPDPVVTVDPTPAPTPEPVPDTAPVTTPEPEITVPVEDDSTQLEDHETKEKKEMTVTQAVEILEGGIDLYLDTFHSSAKSDPFEFEKLFKENQTIVGLRMMADDLASMEAFQIKDEPAFESFYYFDHEDYVDNGLYETARDSEVPVRVRQFVELLEQNVEEETWATSDFGFGGASGFSGSLRHYVTDDGTHEFLETYLTPERHKVREEEIKAFEEILEYNSPGAIKERRRIAEEAKMKEKFTRVEKEFNDFFQPETDGGIVVGGEKLLPKPVPGGATHKSQYPLSYVVPRSLTGFDNYYFGVTREGALFYKSFKNGPAFTDVDSEVNSWKDLKTALEGVLSEQEEREQELAFHNFSSLLKQLGVTAVINDMAEYNTPYEFDIDGSSVEVKAQEGVGNRYIFSHGGKSVEVEYRTGTIPIYISGGKTITNTEAFKRIYLKDAFGIEDSADEELPPHKTEVYQRLTQELKHPNIEIITGPDDQIERLRIHGMPFEDNSDEGEVMDGYVAEFIGDPGSGKGTYWLYLTEEGAFEISWSSSTASAGGPTKQTTVKTGEEVADWIEKNLKSHGAPTLAMATTSSEVLRPITDLKSVNLSGQKLDAVTGLPDLFTKLTELLKTLKYKVHFNGIDAFADHEFPKPLNIKFVPKAGEEPDNLETLLDYLRDNYGCDYSFDGETIAFDKVSSGIDVSAVELAPALARAQVMTPQEMMADGADGPDGETQLLQYAGYPEVFVLDFRGMHHQGKMLNRMVALIEKPIGKNGRVLTDAELARAISETETDPGDGPDTYAYGHDYPAEAFARFFNTVAEQGNIKLNGAELQLLKMLLHHKVIRVGGEGKYEIVEPAKSVVSMVESTQDSEGQGLKINDWVRRVVLGHELSHGLYFTDQDYKDYCYRFWDNEDGFSNGMTQAERQGMIDFLAHYHYDPEKLDLMINETQAYIVHTPYDALKPMKKFPLSEGRVAELKDLFMQHVHTHVPGFPEEDYVTQLTPFAQTKGVSRSFEIDDFVLPARF